MSFRNTVFSVPLIGSARESIRGAKIVKRQPRIPLRARFLDTQQQESD